MIFLIFVGLVSVVFALFFLFFPSQLKKINESSKKTFADIDERLLKHRVGTGISLLLVALLCFLMVNYIRLKIIMF